MKKPLKLDKNKIAKGLRATRRGTAKAKGGYFGAMAIAAEVQARFVTPAAGGRATDRSWTERRLVALAPETLSRLEEMAALVNAASEVKVGALQVAALLLERATAEVDDQAVVELARGKEPGPTSQSA